MKKLVYFFMAASLLMAVSCKKEIPDTVTTKYGVDGETIEPDAVDLGTVVNGKTVKWASFNLGASKEYESGDYYAWGEMSPKNEYSWKTYIYSNGTLNKLTKYCPEDKSGQWDGAELGPDGKTTLLPYDDVAHMKLGGNWRMPTMDELDELLKLKDNKDYTWEPWVASSDGDGVYGLRITRNSTKATIFLPAAGYMDGTENVSTHGHYLSSSLNPKYPDTALGLGFSEIASGKNNYNRYSGFTIRPVCVE